MATATRQPPYAANDVEGLPELIDRINQAGDDPEKWSWILQDHISFGNNKVVNNTAIFNMGSAHDCPNLGEKHCQVADGDSECYAVKDERQYKAPLDYRRRQEYLWDCLDAGTWVEAFLEIVDRKRNPVEFIRFSESGDFRHRGDIIKVDRIAELLEPHDIGVYTYSASSWLDWSEAEHFTVNMSDNRKDDSGEFVTDDYGDRRFLAVPSADDIPDDGIHCPFDKQTHRGELDNRPGCGTCRACIDTKASDVYIVLH